MRRAAAAKEDPADEDKGPRRGTRVRTPTIFYRDTSFNGNQRENTTQGHIVGAPEAKTQPDAAALAAARMNSPPVVGANDPRAIMRARAGANPSPSPAAIRADMQNTEGRTNTSKPKALKPSANPKFGLPELLKGMQKTIEGTNTTIKHRIQGDAYTAVYMTEVNNKSFVLKIQLRSNKTPWQITTEFSAMRALSKADPSLQIQKIVAYGSPADENPSDKIRYYGLLTQFAGPDMLKISQNGTLPECKILEICLVVANTLQNIHNLDWVHRDIKPENITQDGTIIDFGCCE
jgi:serine/threonine protein kinase